MKLSLCKLLISAVLASTLFGCAAPKYRGGLISSPDLMVSKPMVDIVDNPKVRDGFKEAMIAWLDVNNYEVNLLPTEEKWNADNITLTYVGHWEWDMTMYMHRGQINAFYNGTQVGESGYDVTWGSSGNPSKFKTARRKISNMMSLLFTGISTEVLDKQEDE